MFRNRIQEWTRILNPVTQTRVNPKLFTEKRMPAHAFSSIREISSDQDRVEFYLNVSRAYIKLTQVAR